jgi:hypothetical protein
LILASSSVARRATSAVAGPRCSIVTPPLKPPRTRRCNGLEDANVQISLKKPP